MKTTITESPSMSTTGSQQTYDFKTKKEALKWLIDAKKSCWRNNAGTKAEINAAYTIS